MPPATRISRRSGGRGTIIRMSARRGIIYGTLAVVRRSSAYPNVRLLVIGALLFAILPWWPLLAIDLIDFNSLPPSKPVVDAAWTYGFVMAVAAIVLHVAGLLLMTFAFIRIARDQSRRTSRAGGTVAMRDDGSHDPHHCSVDSCNA